MKVLTTAPDIHAELTRLIRACSSCQIAVAWASVGFKAFDLLVTHANKVERMIVGTHFYQTHPSFIETFYKHPGVRFVLNPDGVFHPKVFLFRLPGDEWQCLIGSSNFTQSGFEANDEMAVLLANDDIGASETLHTLTATIGQYWQKAVALGEGELDAYRTAWKRRRQLLQRMQGHFGNPQREDSDDNGKLPLNVPILRMGWTDYFENVKNEHATTLGHSMSGRLKVIRTAEELFSEHHRFNEIDLIGRRKIAGLVIENGIDFRWFGSMKPVGKFQRAIIDNDENLSLALDLIPLVGGISREMYLDYIERYKQAFPQGRHGVPTATRLLAMKRPDTFVCIDGKNKKRLCSAFGVSHTMNYEKYWDSIIERVRDSTWWNADPPDMAGAERDVWEARVAFLDSLFYDE